MDKMMNRALQCSMLVRFGLLVSLIIGCSDTLVPAPSAPLGVTATLIGPTSVRVSWQANSDVERIDRYKVYRGGVEIGEASTNFYLDEGLADRASITYTVVALGSTGYESPESAPVTITTGDATPPRVLQAFPASGAGPISVAQSIVIRLVFSESLDSASVNSNTLSLKVMETGQAVTGTIRYRPNVAVAEFEVPFGAMPAASTIQVTAATGIKDLAGNPLATPFTLTFTTTENTPPTIVSTYPANGATEVDLRPTITIRFSEAMNPSSLDIDLYDVTAHGDLVNSSGTYDAGTNTYTLTAQLQSLRTYQVAVGWNFPVTDLAGNRLAPSSFRFTTRDAGPPIPVEVTPPENATNVDPAAPIRIRFNKPLDPSSIIPQRFSVYPSRPTGDGPVAGMISYEAASYTVVYTPASPLRSATWYGVVLFGLLGADGVAMEDKDRVSHEFMTR